MVIDKKVCTQNYSRTTFEQGGWESIKISFSSQRLIKKKNARLSNRYMLKGTPCNNSSQPENRQLTLICRFCMFGV